MKRLPEVDWKLAETVGVRLTRPGPRVSSAAAADAVAELRDCAARAQELVRRTARLDVPAGQTPVLVVDRPTWLRANLGSLRQLFDRLETSPAPMAGRATGIEVGTILSWLGSKVLGQFDPFYAGGAARGRLLLIAPNVVKAERELAVRPGDFRLWVCLHEETHRVQFAHSSWLADYVRDLALRMMGSLDADAPRWGRLASAIVRGQSDVSLLDVLPEGEPRQVLDHVTAVMSVLEGHAEVIMDLVGSEVIASVGEIRERFNARRATFDGGVDGLLRRLLGLDVKLAQYRDGARFCRWVMDGVGTEGFNRVFVSPKTLPTTAELHDPELWLRRMGDVSGT